MVLPAVRTLKAHRAGPDASQARAISLELKINRFPGCGATTSEILHGRSIRRATKNIGIPLLDFVRLRTTNHCFAASPRRSGPWEPSPCRNGGLILCFSIL